MFKILIVCTGNICRSPAAHAILEKLIADNAKLSQHVLVDSCATHSYHIGSMPDDRVIRVFEENNIPIRHLRARQISQRDYADFDLLLAMDYNHMEILKSGFTASQQKLDLFLQYCQGVDDIVADPYFGDMSGFYQMFDIIHKASLNLIEKLENDLLDHNI